MCTHLNCSQRLLLGKQFKEERQQDDNHFPHHERKGAHRNVCLTITPCSCQNIPDPWATMMGKKVTAVHCHGFLSLLLELLFCWVGDMLWLWLPQRCVRVAKTPFTPHRDNSVNNLQKPEGSGRHFAELEPHKLHKILHLNCDGHYQTKSVQALACAWDKTDKRLCFDRKKQKKNNWKAVTKSNVSNCKSKAQFCDSHTLTLAIILYLATSLWLAPINTGSQLNWK